MIRQQNNRAKINYILICGKQSTSHMQTDTAFKKLRHKLAHLTKNEKIGQVRAPIILG